MNFDMMFLAEGIDESEPEDLLDSLGRVSMMMSPPRASFPSWVPEIKQRSLEELDYIFAVPTRTFIKYNVGTWLPWFTKRYIFFDKNAELKPLYHIDAGIVADFREQEKRGRDPHRRTSHTAHQNGTEEA